ncbi:MAG TPA: hypothetical protein VN873_12670 [Candidatus Angelobacter sp.]|nr:hypothetical protein [Candidatus Angelobacter sp.]
MTGSTLSVRRANVEDLNDLRALWNSARLPGPELEPRLTEFQVAEDTEGKITGSIGFEISGSQGRLHSDVFADAAIADTARDLLWKRIQTLATNHGVLRVWTKEHTSFWARLGFKPAGAEELKKLPESWKPSDPGWLTLQLKNEAVIDAAEREMAMFMSAQKKQTERTVQSMKTVKTLATVLAILFFMAALAGVFYLAMKRSQFMHR